MSKGGAISVGAGGYTQNAGMTDVQAGGLIDGQMFINGGTVDLDGTLGPNGASVGANGSFTGKGTIIGNLVNWGMLSSENMTVFGDATMGSTSIFDEQILGLDNFGRLLVSGNVYLDGTLDINLLNGFLPAIGSKFFFIDSSSVNGAFAAINGSAINSGEEFQVLYNPNNVELCVVSTSNPVCGAAPPAVPEPRGIVLLGTVAVGALWYARRRNRKLMAG